MPLGCRISHEKSGRLLLCLTWRYKTMNIAFRLFRDGEAVRSWDWLLSTISSQNMIFFFTFSWTVDVRYGFALCILTMVLCTISCLEQARSS